MGPGQSNSCTLFHQHWRDDQMAQLPPHSLVINATGMGKDSRGSLEEFEEKGDQ
jgi:hypothetical protein